MFTATRLAAFALLLTGCSEYGFHTPNDAPNDTTDGAAVPNYPGSNGDSGDPLQPGDPEDGLTGDPDDLPGDPDDGLTDDPKDDNPGDDLGFEPGDFDDDDDDDWPTLEFDPDWPGIPVENPGDLHMTGGGQMPHLGGDLASHGFTIHCDDGKDNSNLQMNWDGDSFSMDQIDFVQCWDDPTISGGQPDPGFDTIEVAGIGSLNGVGGVPFYLIFTDDGEPGDTDTAWVEIVDGAQFLAFDGILEAGNHQAH